MGAILLVNEAPSLLQGNMRETPFFEGISPFHVAMLHLSI